MPQWLFISIPSLLHVDLPTRRASKAELGARKIYTMQATTEREERVGERKLPTTDKAAKDFGKVYLTTITCIPYSTGRYEN